tara:strand:+ start:1856 stop:2167 length:312 start_codon:yes stop_codon:yes gene_type:complete
MSELLNINNNLTSSLNELIREISSRGFFGVRIWLDDNEINDLDEIIFLRKYLREINKRFVRFCIKDGYAAYWEPNQLGREHLCRKLKLTDIELTNIIKNKRGE